MDNEFSINGYTLYFINAPVDGFSHCTFYVKSKTDDIVKESEMWNQPDVKFIMEEAFGIVIFETNIWMTLNSDSSVDITGERLITVDYTICDNRSYLKWLNHQSLSVIPIAASPGIVLGKYDCRYVYTINMIKMKDCYNNFFFNHKLQADISFIFAPEEKNYVNELTYDILPSLESVIKEAIVPQCFDPVIRFHHTYSTPGVGAHAITAYIAGFKHDGKEYRVEDITREYLCFAKDILLCKEAFLKFQIILNSVFMDEDSILTVSNWDNIDYVSRSREIDPLIRVVPQFYRYRLINNRAIQVTKPEDQYPVINFTCYGKSDNGRFAYEEFQREKTVLNNIKTIPSCIIKIGLDDYITFNGMMTIPAMYTKTQMLDIQMIQRSMVFASDINYVYLAR